MIWVAMALVWGLILLGWPGEGDQEGDLPGDWTIV